MNSNPVYIDHQQLLRHLGLIGSGGEPLEKMAEIGVARAEKILRAAGLHVLGTYDQNAVKKHEGYTISYPVGRKVIVTGIPGLTPELHIPYPPKQEEGYMRDPR